MFKDALPERAKAALKKIMPVVNKERFYLAGGSGLALQIGHRISEDLDFFRGSLFDANSLFSALKKKTVSSEEILMESNTLSAIF